MLYVVKFKIQKSIKLDRSKMFNPCLDKFGFFPDEKKNWNIVIKFFIVSEYSATYKMIQVPVV